MKLFTVRAEKLAERKYVPIPLALCDDTIEGIDMSVVPHGVTMRKDFPRCKANENVIISV